MESRVIIEPDAPAWLDKASADITIMMAFLRRLRIDPSEDDDRIIAAVCRDYPDMPPDRVIEICNRYLAK